MDDRVQKDLHPAETNLVEHAAGDAANLAEILEGLGRSQKKLSPKFFYDQTGSELFDAICELPEYYLTRTELKIMHSSIREMAELVGPQASIIEFGSGSSLKIHLLLQHLEDPAVYVPVDISKEHLQASAAALSLDFPTLEILPVAADFTRPFPLPNPAIPPLRNLVYFPGSTIGNFNRKDALALMKVMYQEAGEDGALLIGVDLVKDTEILERAYNDSQGVTAAFNLNMLTRINAEFNANFDLNKFEHKAIYDSAAGRIEMRLYSLEEQIITVAGHSFSFDQGEHIISEHSHKYTLNGFKELAGLAGFEVEKVWTDTDQLFSVQYCTRS